MNCVIKPNWRAVGYSGQCKHTDGLQEKLIDLRDELVKLATARFGREPEDVDEIYY